MKEGAIRFVQAHRLVVLLAVGVVLGAFILWAASDLVGAANSKAQQSAIASTETQIAAFDSLPSGESVQKKPSPPVGDWATINKNEKRIKEIDKEYLPLAEQAQKTKAETGTLPDDVIAKLNALTEEYVKLQNECAEAWQGMKPVCKTRAQVSRDAANTRQKSNAVLVAVERDQKQLDEMKKAEEQLAKSHTAYVKSEEAKDVPAEEKTRIKQNVVPQIQNALQKVAALIQELQGLIKEAQSVAKDMQSAKGNPMAAIGAAKKGANIVSEFQNILKVVTGTQKNLNTIMKNAQTLAK